MSTIKKRYKAIREAVVALGYECRRIDYRKSGHLCCHVRDDAGNRFKVFTASTPHAAGSLKDFQQDVRRQSMRAKGIIDP